jgi:ketosteroid isomerase-like protein
VAESSDFSRTARSLLDAYAASMIAGDMDRWIAAWDEEGVQMPPDTPARSGKQAILESMKIGLQMVRYVSFSIGEVETFAFGEFGVARGSYTYSFVRAGSSERNDRVGKFLTLFRRKPDGSWKILRDCFNLDSPAR